MIDVSTLEGWAKNAAESRNQMLRELAVSALLMTAKRLLICCLRVRRGGCSVDALDAALSGRYLEDLEKEVRRAT